MKKSYTSIIQHSLPCKYSDSSLVRCSKKIRYFVIANSLDVYEKPKNLNPNKCAGIDQIFYGVSKIVVVWLSIYVGKEKKLIKVFA